MQMKTKCLMLHQSYTVHMFLRYMYCSSDTAVVVGTLGKSYKPLPQYEDKGLECFYHSSPQSTIQGPNKSSTILRGVLLFQQYLVGHECKYDSDILRHLCQNKLAV